MKKLIIIRGPLGVGKTTVAKKLTAKLNANYISIDSVLETNRLDQAEETMGEIEFNLGRKFSTIFWDSDGTLVDTEPPYFKATQTVLKEVGIDLTREWYVNEQLKKGMSAFDLARSLGQSEESIQVLRGKRDELYLESLKSAVKVMDGVVTTLEALHGKIPMGIVTTSRKVNFEQIMASTGLAKYFDFFIVREDVVHEKPDPEPYLKAWERSGLPKKECLVIEDTERGVISAKAAGLTCLAIPNELSKDNDFSKADGIIKNLVEILEFI